MRLGGMRLGSDASFHLYIWNDMYEYFLEANPDLGSKMGRGKLDLIRATQPSCRRRHIPAFSAPHEMLFQLVCFADSQ